MHGVTLLQSLIIDAYIILVAVNYQYTGVLLLTINPALGVRGGIHRSTSGTGWRSLVGNDREFFKQLTDMVGLENRACCYRLLPQPLRQREI